MRVLKASYVAHVDSITEESERNKHDFCEK